MVGGLDGLLRCFSLPSDLAEPIVIEKPDRIIQEHYDNITALRYASSAANPTADPSKTEPDLLLSSSWDYTARSFRRDFKGKWHRCHLLKGHESAVWGVEIVKSDLDAEQYLTASADLFVRFYRGEELEVVWSGHSDVVRDVRLLPNLAWMTQRDPAIGAGPLFAASSCVFASSRSFGMSVNI